jgi:SMI1-KNR4 cell-wall
MSHINELAEAIRERSGPDEVAGASGEDIADLKAMWGVSEFPSEYNAFLSLMGVSAGRLLVGTDMFFPRLLRLREFVDGFVAENEWRPKETQLVIGMHQGYQIYYLDSTEMDDPPVVLIMEDEPEPIQSWVSFTDFLWGQFHETYRSA